MTSAARDKPSWLIQFERAKSELAAGRTRAALPLLRKAVALNPRLTEAWGLIGDILTAGGDFPGARQAYGHAGGS
ncbi:MAG: tetratricopeptide repeat protein, partial [Caulobacteraceae bacterium]